MGNTLASICSKVELKPKLREESTLTHTHTQTQISLQIWYIDQGPLEIMLEMQTPGIPMIFLPPIRRASLVDISSLLNMAPLIREDGFRIRDRNVESNTFHWLICREAILNNILPEALTLYICLLYTQHVSSSLAREM